MCFDALQTEMREESVCVWDAEGKYNVEDEWSVWFDEWVSDLSMTKRRREKEVLQSERYIESWEFEWVSRYL